MLDHFFLYEKMSQSGFGGRCPRCYQYRSFCDGFGLCRCQICGNHFSIVNRRPARILLKDTLKRLVIWSHVLALKWRGKES